MPPRKPPDLVPHVSISFDFDEHVANDNDPVSFESPNNTNDNVNDQPTHQVNTTTCSVSKRSTHPTNRGALIDRGANGGLAGADVRITGTVPHGFVNVEGIDNHQLPNIPIVTAEGVVQTQRGPVILVVNQCAHTPHGKTICWNENSIPCCLSVWTCLLSYFMSLLSYVTLRSM